MAPAQIGSSGAESQLLANSPAKTLSCVFSATTTVQRRSRAQQTGCDESDACINTIRFLCVDAIESANSGHPGTPMGIAPTAFVLFDRFLQFNPCNPHWINRDRFVLSAGHASALQYSLLYLYGYDSVNMEDLKSFRKLGSRTPGHPENVITAGVEVTTGPLGQGFCNAVGFAIAEAHMAATYNRPPAYNVIDNYTYCIMGDGCVMEGMTSEAASLAGHLRLSKLIVIYDDNHVCIEGSTDLVFTEDVSNRFRSYGWNVSYVENGDTDLDAISKALYAARHGGSDKPTLVRVKTTIGYGSPGKGASAAVHGSALGADENAATRSNLGWEYPPFHVPPHILQHFRRKRASGTAAEATWRRLFDAYERAHPVAASALQKYALPLQRHTSDVVAPPRALSPALQVAVESALRRTAHEFAGVALATRKLSQAMLNALAPVLPGLIGGAADVAPSTLTWLGCSNGFSAHCRSGRNLRFGVREHSMGAITNGIALAGYRLVPYCSTFLVFSDYMRAAMRMASLAKAQTIFVMTHDSIALGEDGATHQPIEHLASLRAMPNHAVWRPADAKETAAAYASAVLREGTPHTIALSRQNVPPCPNSSYQLAKRGAYIVVDIPGNAQSQRSTLHSSAPNVIVISSGSELSLSLDAAHEVRNQMAKDVRVVSMPCWEAFEEQDEVYREFVLPREVGRQNTIAVEAASSFGWARYADHTVCVDTFGCTGPGKHVMGHFGLSKSNIILRICDILRAQT